MRPKIPPKEGIHKLKETIQDLKSRLREVEKENVELRNQLASLGKPVTSKPASVEDQEFEAWRQDFLRRVRGTK